MNKHEELALFKAFKTFYISLLNKQPESNKPIETLAKEISAEIVRLHDIQRQWQAAKIPVLTADGDPVPVTAQDLRALYIRKTNSPDVAASYPRWEEIPQFVQDAWEEVRQLAQRKDGHGKATS